MRDQPADPVGATSALPIWLLAFPITAGIHLVHRAWIREVVLQRWLERPEGAPQPWYVDHALLTRWHLLTGALLVVLGFLQFHPWIRTRHPAVHRWVGRAFVAIGAVAAVTGIWMNWVFPYGSVAKYVGGYFFGVVVIVSVSLGVREIRRGNIFAHRAWMSRAFAIVVAAGLQRAFISIWERYFDGQTTDTVVGICLWLGAFVALAVNEILLVRIARRTHSVPAETAS